MLFIAMVIGAVAVGALAQIWKRRTGAIWAFVAMITQAAAAVFGGMAIAINSPGLTDQPSGAMAFAILTVGVGAGFAALVVATLPRRSV